MALWDTIKPTVRISFPSFWKNCYKHTGKRMFPQWSWIQEGCQWKTIIKAFYNFIFFVALTEFRMFPLPPFLLEGYILYCTNPLPSLLWLAVTLVPSHWHSAQLPRVFSFLLSLGTSGLFLGLEMDNTLYPCCHSQSLVPSGTVWVSMCASPLIHGSLFSLLSPFLMELLVSCRELKFLLQLLKLRLGNWWGL